MSNNDGGQAFSKTGHVGRPSNPALEPEEKREAASVLLNRYMTSRLRAMYQAFGGDLTLCLVLGEVATINTQNIKAEDLRRQGFSPERIDLLSPCSAAMVHESTGIPRETVRRKLFKLVELGLLTRTEDDMYYVTDFTGESFSAFNESQTEDIMDAYDKVTRLMQSD